MKTHRENIIEILDRTLTASGDAEVYYNGAIDDLEELIKKHGSKEMGSMANINSEKKALVALVDAFAEEMKKKLLQKYNEDWNGWDKEHHREGIEGGFNLQISKHKKDYIDIANFAAMLWNFEQEK